MDMQQLFAAAQQMQEQLMNAQQALAEAEVTGTSGGGLVKATVNGQGELMDLSIEPAAVDPDDAEETARTFAEAMQGGGLPGMPGMPGGLDLPSGLDLSSLGLGAGGHEPDDSDDEET